MPVFSVTLKTCLTVTSSLTLTRRVKSILWGLAVTLLSVPLTRRKRRKELAHCLPPSPSGVNSGEIFLSGVNDILCLSQIQAVARCHSDNDKVKMKASRSPPKKSLSTHHQFSTLRLKKGQRPASYLEKCVFPSSVRHTGHAWEARCTVVAGAETENTAQGGGLGANGRNTHEHQREHTMVPIVHHACREAPCRCSALHTQPSPALSICTSVSSPSLGLEKQEAGNGEAGSRRERGCNQHEGPYL